MTKIIYYGNYQNKLLYKNSDIISNFNKDKHFEKYILITNIKHINELYYTKIKRFNKRTLYINKNIFFLIYILNTDLYIQKKYINDLTITNILTNEVNLNAKSNNVILIIYNIKQGNINLINILPPINSILEQQSINSILEQQAINSILEQQSINSVNESINSVNESINSVNESINSVNGSVNSVNESINSVNESINSVNESINSVNESINSVNESINSVNESQFDINTSKLSNPSNEQKSFIDAIGKGYDVVGDCVAGSGKSTTGFLIAKNYRNIGIFSITFSRKLKEEGKEKIKSFNIPNMKIHSYHSLCVRYYGSGSTDNEMDLVVQINKHPKSQIPVFSLLILDEIQDMKPSHYYFINKFIIDTKRQDKIQILILGDKYQSIFKFLGADDRFLKYCNEIWNRKFLPLSLNISYRNTQHVASFINKNLLGIERIISNKTGQKVQYHYRNTYKLSNLADTIKNQINKGTFNPDDIFILAYSIKNNENNKDKPIKAFERILVELGLPVFYPTSDLEEINHDMSKNKILFSTLHQSKGMERKWVIVFGFDDSYFKYYDKKGDRTTCPELLYVATTRSTELLTLLHDIKYPPLPFLKGGLEEIRNSPHVNFIDKFCSFKEDDNKYNNEYNYSVTDLVKYIKPKYSNIIEILLSKLFTTLNYDDTMINIPSNVHGTESVSDINGIIIPAMFESKFGTSTIEKHVRDHGNEYFDKYPTIRDLYDSLPDKITTISDYSKLGIIYKTMTDNIHNKIGQIKYFNWLKEEDINKCHDIMNLNIRGEPKYEQYLQYEYESCKFGKISIVGIIDIEDDNTIFEIKCTSNIKLEHKLQLALYAFIIFKINENYRKNFKILNIKTSECLLLKYDIDIITNLINIILDNKFDMDYTISDETFIAKYKQ